MDKVVYTEDELYEALFKATDELPVDHFVTVAAAKENCRYLAKKLKEMGF